jgi:hypothetical protein
MISRFEELSPLRFALRLGVMVLAPAAIAACLVEMLVWKAEVDVNPPTVAQLQHGDPSLVWTGPLQLYPAIKVANFKLDQADIVVVGASRGGQFRSAMFLPYRFYNMSMVGWTFDRLLKVIGLIIEHNAPKVILLNTDFFMFGSNYERRWTKTEADMPLQPDTTSVRSESLKSISRTFFSAPKMLSGERREMGSDQPGERFEFGHVFGPAAESAVTGFRHDGSIEYSSAFLGQSHDMVRSLATVLGQTDSGSGQQIDPSQVERLRKIVELARWRGVSVVGVQLPFPRSVRDVLDSESDYTEGNTVFRGSDMKIWSEFERRSTARLLDDMGMLFFDFSRFPEADEKELFVDAAHPSEYLVFSCVVQMLKDPRMNSLLPDIDREALERERLSARREGHVYDVFRDRF